MSSGSCRVLISRFVVSVGFSGGKQSPMAGATKSKLYFVCPTGPSDPDVVDRALVYCTRCFVRVWECVRSEMCRYGERREWRMENGAA